MRLRGRRTREKDKQRVRDGKGEKHREKEDGKREGLNVYTTT